MTATNAKLLKKNMHDAEVFLLQSIPNDQHDKPGKGLKTPNIVSLNDDKFVLGTKNNAIIEKKAN